jgi:predicted RNA-binding Zn-ribbon protein involved in translation (DUF1610 family)
VGGLGSTRWHDCERKLTVEECFSLDINILVKDGFIKLGYRDSDVIVWTNQITGMELGSCEVQADITNIDDSWISFTYKTLTSEQISQGIYLLATTPNYGGIRWWFECPDCGKKVIKLYLAKEPHFICRKCGNLTYNSCLNSRSSFDYGKLLSREISMSHGIPFKTVARLWREKTLKVGRRLSNPEDLGK